MISLMATVAVSGLPPGVPVPCPFPYFHLGYCRAEKGAKDPNLQTLESQSTFPAARAETPQ